MSTKIFILQRLEDVFGYLAQQAERMRQRCAICPDCGANRYTGKPCVKY